MSSRVFKGRDPDFKLYQGSLGEYVLECMKSHPPESILQVDGLTGESLTVEEVLQDGMEVAAGLQARGVGPGDVVILTGNYSRRYFAALLGTILQNAAIFPLNPSLKQTEMEHLVRVAQPKIVFADTQPSFYITAALQNLGFHAEVVLLYDQPEPHEHTRRYEDIISSTDGYRGCSINDPANEIAAIMHSSGTTGLPKAILMPHRNLIFNIQVWGDVKPVKDKAVGLQATLGSWLIGFLLSIKSYIYGFKRVYVFPNTAENLAHAIQRERPEWVITMPFGLQQVLLLPGQYDLSSIKYMLIGGTPPMKNLDQLFYEKMDKNVMLEQAYGSTELSYYTEVFRGTPYESAGRLGPGISCKVVDPKTEEHLGPGEVGEVRVKSLYPLMKCYAGKPEQTNAAFDSEGYFRTGDIGWVTEDNQFYITGRIKDFIQTKLGRVTPWVLENYIMTLGGIEDVAVVGIPEEDECCRIAAAVILSPESQLTEEQIHQYVQSNFSGMNHLTGGIKFVSKLPRNSNGKIQREKVLDLFI